MANDAMMRGNAAFNVGSWREAISHFTDAINLDPTNHVLYSKRSAALASVGLYRKALSDAAKTIELKPDWPEGYSRLAALFVGLRQIDKAIATYKKGLDVHPSNVDLKAGLADAQASALLPLTLPFSGSDLGVERPADLTTRDLLKNMEEVKAPELMEVWEDEREKKKRRKAEAQKEKEEGNAAYRKKDLGTALKHYTKALELDDEDISSLTSRAIVQIELAMFGECMKDSNKDAKRKRKIRACTREETALAKLVKLPKKSYDPAIETFQKASTKHSDTGTLQELNDAEKAKKEIELQEYPDARIAGEKGNKFFVEQMYTKAVKYHTETLCNAYSNRAAWYMKLGAFPEGLRDAEKCIELDPSSAQGYGRKGAIQFLMKEYEEALKTYQEGMKHDPNNQDFVDGIRRCTEHINRTNRGGLVERNAKAMQDP